MSRLSRRDLLTWFAVAPLVPRFIVQSGHAATPQSVSGYDGPVVVVVRMLGGNDGLNTVIPIRDDRYFVSRPTIAIPASEATRLPGGDLALNGSLSDFWRLMEEGCAGIVQGVGYPRSSRSHQRATEIWESGSTADEPPPDGWLGRYLDHSCECHDVRTAGVQFAASLDLTLASSSGRSTSIGHPQLLLEGADDLRARDRRSHSGPLDYLTQVHNSLGESARELRRAAGGSGRAFDYPDTAFGQSLRWTGDMIEAGCPTRAYYVTIGSFDTPESFSFDTHIDQRARHRVLFPELGQGLLSFTTHMKRTGHFHRVLLLTFSDFGRQLAENRTQGTDHGDASVLFILGGRVRAGLLGSPADLGRVRDGGLEATVDFREIYAAVLANWLGANPAPILGEGISPYSILA